MDIDNFDGDGVFDTKGSKTFIGSTDKGDEESLTTMDRDYDGWYVQDSFSMKLPDYPDALMVHDSQFFLIGNIDDSSNEMVDGSDKVNGYIGLTTS